MNKKLIGSIILGALLFLLFQSGVFAQTLDDMFTEIAQQVPEFGGLFLSDEERTLNIYLTDITNQKEAEDAIKKVFGDRFSGKEVRVLQGKYGFLQLKEWHDKMITVLSLSGVIFTDIDESRNLLKAGVESLDLRAVVEEELDKLGIPREAVIIEKAEPIRQLPLEPIKPITEPTKPLIPLIIWIVGGAILVLIGGFVIWRLVTRQKRV